MVATNGRTVTGFGGTGFLGRRIVRAESSVILTELSPFGDLETLVPSRLIGCIVEKTGAVLHCIKCT
jgi:hypothetical protein